MKHLGKNMIRLICHRMSVQIVPADAPNGMELVIHAILNNQLADQWMEAKEWTEQAIETIRKAERFYSHERGINEWKDATDDEIAGEILRRIEERKHGK